jgi:hypothetical protein
MGRGEERKYTRGEVVIPSQPAAVGSVNVKVGIGELQVGNGVGHAILVNWRGLGAQLDVHIGDEVGQGVGLEHNGEVDVGRRGNLLHEGGDVLTLVTLEAAGGALELARALAGAAVAVGQVVQDKSDELILAGGILLHAGVGDGLVDERQVGDTGDPVEHAGVLDGPDLGSVGRVALLEEVVVNGLELSVVLVVGGQLPALKGVL